jgi:hypothetical protein
MISLVTIAIATDASGDFSENFQAQGKLLQYRYVPGSLLTGADLTVVGATTGQSFINHSNAGTSNISRAPRQPTHDTTGAASLYAGSGEPVEDYIVAGGEQLTFTIAEGGVSKAGTLYMWFGE